MPIFKEFKKDIQQNKLNTFYILAGEETSVMDKYLNLIDFEVVKSVEHAISRSTSKNLFGGSGVYLVRGDEEVLKSDVKDIIKYFKDQTLILVYDKVDKRKKLFKTGSKYLYKFTEIKNAYLYVMSQLNVTEDVAKHLATKCQNDIGQLDFEINKLKYIDKPIDISLVNEVVVANENVDVWEFVDSVLKRDAVNSYRLYEELKSLKYTEIQLIGMLFSNLKTVFIIKNMQHRTNKEISQLSGINLWLVSNCRREIVPYYKNISIVTILNNLLEIQQLEVDIKNGKVDPEIGFMCLMNEFMA